MVTLVALIKYKARLGFKILDSETDNSFLFLSFYHLIPDDLCADTFIKSFINISSRAVNDMHERDLSESIY